MTACANLMINAVWHSNECHHREEYYFQHVDIAQDIELGNQLVDASVLMTQNIYRVELLPGDLIPPHDPNQVKTLTRPLELPEKSLAIGRFYATRLFLPEARAIPPYARLIDLQDDDVTIDLNHPLADTQIQIEIRIMGQYESKSMRMLDDCLQQIMRDGPGMQRCGDLPDYSIDADNIRRLDEADDAVHYQQPDFEDTFDRIGGLALSDAYAEFLQPGMRLLDIMCGAQSYLPPQISGLHATGIGLNEQELQANRQLSKYFVHNVNSERNLPFDDNQFDAIVFTAAVEYLIDPHTTFSELHRVTRPHGIIIVSFTDHWNTHKNIALWQELPQFERLRLVMDYLRQGGNISMPGTLTIRGLARDREDRRYPEQPQADPVFITYATVEKP